MVKMSSFGSSQKISGFSPGTERLLSSFKTCWPKLPKKSAAATERKRGTRYVASFMTTQRQEGTLSSMLLKTVRQMCEETVRNGSQCREGVIAVGG